MVLPVGRVEQDLLVLRKTEQGMTELERIAVRFVPLVRVGEG